MQINLAPFIKYRFFRVGFGVFFAVIPLLSVTAHTQAAPILMDDLHGSAAVTSSQNISLTYQEPATLFNLITVNVPITVSVDAKGTTKVSYPWYSFLLATNQTSLAIRVQAVVAREFAAQHTSTTTTTGGLTSGAMDESIDSSTDTFSAGTQARLTASLNAVLQDQANIDTSVTASL